MKNMVSCNAVSKATKLSMGSLELLLSASVFTVLDPNDMDGTTLPREALGADTWAFQDYYARKVDWLPAGLLASRNLKMVLEHYYRFRTLSRSVTSTITAGFLGRKAGQKAW